MAETSSRGFSTRALHTQIPYLHPNAHIMPIYLSSTYEIELDPANNQELAFKYPRIAHPNGELLEPTIASLEGGEAAVGAADGMRAISLAVTAMLDPNTEGTIVSTLPLYSHTYQLFSQDIAVRGKRYMSLHSPESCADDFLNIIIHAKSLRAPVEVLFIETPANPTLTIWDIKTLSHIARAHGICVIVDSTFASPYNQRPLEYGADLVVHSLTKYLCGNGTTLGGIVIGSRERIKKIEERGQREGGHLHPMAAWLVQLGLQTLDLRMERHNKYAAMLARFLNAKENRKYIAKVYYPGLRSHEGHTVARDQMQTTYGKPGFGGMVSFKLARTEWVKPFAETLKASFITLAVSLGCTSSIFSVPARQIHSALPPQERNALGIDDNLIRFSVGLENYENIQNAFEITFKSLP